MSAEMIELYHDERLDQSETLHFQLPAGSAKSYLIAEDHDLEWRGRRFYIDEIEQARDARDATIRVEAPAIWQRLADDTYVGSLVLDDLTPAQGLATILDGTLWTAGPGTTTAVTAYSLERQDCSRLELLRAWAKITGRFLVFNSGDYTVDLVDSRGVDRGVGFRYRRNIARMRRRRRPPVATVLYPYGAEGLTIAGLNGGLEYLENFDYYTEQGLTLAEARARHTRRKVWSDTSFLRDAELLAAARTHLVELARPEVTYELDVVDLTELLPVLEELKVGDIVRVQDPDFATDVRTTVVRLVRYPYEPARNKIELSFLPVTLLDPTAASERSSRAAEWHQFTGPTSADYLIRNDATYITNRIPLDFREGGRANFHLDLWATGVGAGVMHVEVLEAVTNVVAFHPIAVDYTNGATVRATLQWAAEDLAGQYDYRVRVTTVASGGPSPTNGVDLTADTPAEAPFWVLAQGAVQQTPTAPNSQRFYYTGAVQQFTVPDGVTELTIEAVGASGGNASNVRTTAGAGASVIHTRTVIPGTVLDVYVAGGTGYPNAGAGDTTAVGNNGGTGGGCSYVTTSGGAFAAAYVVAAGGGAAGYSYAANWTGGDAGFFTGGTGTGGAHPGQGATQFAGGTAGTGGTAGSSGTGGAAGDTTNSFAGPGGGGGAGWYGGGGAGEAAYSGAGGEAGPGGGGSGYLADGAYDIVLADGFNAPAAGAKVDGWVLFTWET